MNVATKIPDSPEAEVSRAIDAVLAAERDAKSAVEAAAARAEDVRRETAADAHRILAAADRRIGGLHRKVADDLQRDIATLRREAADRDAAAPAEEREPEQLNRLAAAVAEWLTTDAAD